MVYLQPLRRNSVLKCAQHPKIVKNFTKNLFWGVQSRSRSSMLINLKSLSSALVTISGTYVSICNRFHTRRADRGKNNVFLRGYPSLMPSLERNSLTQKHEILSRKTKVLGAAYSEDFVILACTVLIQITSATDRRTERR